LRLEADLDYERLGDEDVHLFLSWLLGDEIPCAQDFNSAHYNAASSTLAAQFLRRSPVGPSTDG